MFWREVRRATLRHFIALVVFLPLAFVYALLVRKGVPPGSAYLPAGNSWLALAVVVAGIVAAQVVWNRLDKRQAAPKIAAADTSFATILDESGTKLSTLAGHVPTIWLLDVQADTDATVRVVSAVPGFGIRIFAAQPDLSPTAARSALRKAI